ncbi:hypothetical protein BIV57_21585 [Mangrovactinospora gilvigrisea]|uniref:OmpR/PhoB-type domain-containing protein n=1 Tax=Mangrovactinospora gilvigrisea TaxID=1428644 RepID=A0A1J7C1I0_9ACTN|nr:BTAD domain-containing putative transcriptional regulator [Mangrovactinospora gilvigrisea]OIV35424.1 hypothetical protein BIV57_21585 [Mangrovactinospora gilvigrisea]
MTQRQPQPPQPPTPPSVRIDLLGPLEVRVDGRPVEIRGRLTRALLVRLVLERGRPVPTPRLVSDLWPDHRPTDPHEAMHSFVYALRRALEPARVPRSAPTLLVSEHAGYALRLGEDAADAWRFEAAVQEATRALGADRGVEAVRRLEAALALWRGPALDGFASRAWASRESARLETLRELAQECLREGAR